MRNKVFLDTNILLDLLISVRTNSKNTIKAINEFVAKNYILVVDSISLATISYIGSEKNNMWSQTKEFLKGIVFDDDLWEIYYPDKSCDEQILNFMDKNVGLDYEDLHQYFCAKFAKCKFIITNDKNFTNIDIKLVRTNQ
ncbi:MAG: type II toxin-antitoxin system VapC family toxin [Campylobacter sp.]|nr:type II toxin-antitoxin system VapC family toxin [Campylobacter sp.]